MHKNMAVYVIALLFVIVGVVGFLRFNLGGDEDAWICKDGVWVAHGSPRNPPPQIPCKIKTSPSRSAVSPIQNDLATLYFQPRQCQQMSWDEWYASGGAEFNLVQEPTYEEIVVAYYAQQGIEVVTVKRIESDEMVCQACDICPTSYSLKITVPSDQVGKLTLAGWMRNENDQQPTRKKIIVP